MFLIDYIQSVKTDMSKIEGLKLLQIPLNEVKLLHRVQNMTIAQWKAPSIAAFPMPCTHQAVLHLLI